MTTGALDLVNRADGSNGRIIHLLGGSLSISADGTKVAFLSYESDVDPDVEVAPDPEVLHAYVRDLETGSTELVDCIDGDPCAPAPGGVSNDGIDMSGDGRYVLIHRADAPGGACIDRPELDYACTQFYVRDMVSRTTTLASRADGVDGPPANSYVSTAYLSDDGRHVAFDTAATNLEPELPANTPWLSYEWTYVRDLDGATTTLVSRADGADGHAADTGAHANGISADGSKVMFGAFDDSLAGFPKDAGFEAFVRDVEDSRTELVSRRDGGFGLPAATATDGTSTGWGDISAGGDFVVFSSSDLSLTGDPDPEESHVFRRQITGDPAPPEVGEKVQLAPEEGPVVVKIPDSPFFEQLERGTQVPTGSIIDATDGALEIRSESPFPEEPERHMVWSGGRFVTDQASSAEALTQSILSGPLLDCDTPDRLTPAGLKQFNGRPPAGIPIPGRKLWGHGGKGHQSKGGKSSASVRGTEWLVWDTCDGETVTYVVEGRVEVEDDDRARTVFVDPGELYVAPGPPDAAITQGPAGTTSDSSPSFWFDSGEPWEGYECRLDERVWSDCASPWTGASLGSGPHAFSVRAVDGNGSVPVPGATRAFRVDPSAAAGPTSTDSRPPQTKIVAGPGRRSTAKRNAKVSFRFAADEADSSFQCKMDDSKWKRCSSLMPTRSESAGIGSRFGRSMPPETSTPLRTGGQFESADPAEHPGCADRGSRHRQWQQGKGHLPY